MLALRGSGTKCHHQIANCKSDRFLLNIDFEFASLPLPLNTIKWLQIFFCLTLNICLMAVGTIYLPWLSCHLATLYKSKKRWVESRTWGINGPQIYPKHSITLSQLCKLFAVFFSPSLSDMVKYVEIVKIVGIDQRIQIGHHGRVG